MTDYSTQINSIIAQLPQWLKSIFFLKSARLKEIIFKIIDFRIRSKKKYCIFLLQNFSPLKLKLVQAHQLDTQQINPPS